MSNRALVIENDPTDDVCRLGDWLTEAGLELDIKRPHLGEDLPETLDGYAAFVVLGGEQSAYDDVTWFPQLESLLRKATRYRVPTLGICLGGQLLAQAHGGRVERAEAGLEIGARLVAKRDAAGNDPLFGPMPMAPDVVQYHYDEITQLPVGAVLMAASPRYPVQAFRIGDRAWGTQFHLETDTKMFANWSDTEALVAGVEAIQDDMEEVWKPFAQRFAQIALGQLAEVRGNLPIL